MAEQTTIPLIWQDIGVYVQVLGIGGTVGALMDALIAPEGDRKKQAVRSIAGVVAAVFVGGFFAGMVAHLVADPAYAYLASGYICGHGGQAAMRVAQKKILGKGHPNVD